MSDSSSSSAAPKWQLHVHLPCGQLRGWAGRPQGCPCEPSEPWPGCDVSRAQDLCLVCARGTAGGTSRWSWLGCTTCRSVDQALRDWLGMPVLPLGRHSIMNGVGLRVATASQEEVDAFCVRLEGLELGWDRLHAWARDEARRLARSFADAGPDVPLEVWQRTFPPSLEASLDAYERILETSLPTTLRDQLGRGGEH